MQSIMNFLFSYNFVCIRHIVRNIGKIWSSFEKLYQSLNNFIESQSISRKFVETVIYWKKHSWPIVEFWRYKFKSMSSKKSHNNRPT